jgi:hypothetical protein
MAVQREKVEQAHIVQLLRSFGRVYVMGTRRRSGDFQGTMQSPGIPDLMAFLRPPPLRRYDPARGQPFMRLLFVECKARGGRLRAEQQLFRDEAVAAGIAHVVGDLDAVIAWLIDAGYLKADSVPHYRQPAAAAAARSV